MAYTADDWQAQLEEVLALQSIYAENFRCERMSWFADIFLHAFGVSIESLVAFCLMQLLSHPQAAACLRA
jgi:hypothetical protein